MEMIHRLVKWDNGQSGGGGAAGESPWCSPHSLSSANGLDAMVLVTKPCMYIKMQS